MPLVNEVVIGLKDKNKFNNSDPRDDAQFLTYVTNPTLPALIQLPAVTGQSLTVSGSMIFGIGTQADNALGSAKVFNLDDSGYLGTVFNGNALSRGFMSASGSLTDHDTNSNDTLGASDTPPNERPGIRFNGLFAGLSWPAANP